MNQFIAFADPSADSRVAVSAELLHCDQLSSHTLSA